MSRRPNRKFKIRYILPSGWRLLKPAEHVRDGDWEPDEGVLNWIPIDDNSGTEIGRPARGFPVIRKLARAA